MNIHKRELELVNAIFERRMHEAEELVIKIKNLLESNPEQAEAHLVTLNSLYKKISDSVFKISELKDKILNELEKDFQ